MLNVILLNIIMLNDIMMIIIMLNTIVLNAIMPIVFADYCFAEINSECYDECHFAISHYYECCGSR
jgi:hypothetical protein